MLALGRKKNESIYLTIGAIRIRVVVIEATFGKTRLGIDAPPEVKIYREEIQKEIDADERSGFDADSVPSL